MTDEQRLYRGTNVSDEANKHKSYQGGDTWQYTVADDRSGVRLTLASVVTQSGFEAGDKVTVTRLEEGRLLVERQEDVSEDEQEEETGVDWGRLRE